MVADYEGVRLTEAVWKGFETAFKYARFSVQIGAVEEGAVLRRTVPSVR